MVAITHGTGTCRYGSYDRSLSVTRNVNLPDSLLSRFDMLFVVLDCMNERQDRQVGACDCGADCINERWDCPVSSCACGADCINERWDRPVSSCDVVVGCKE